MSIPIIVKSFDGEAKAYKINDNSNLYIRLSTNPPVHQWIAKEAYILACKILPEAAQLECDKFLEEVIAGSKDEDYEYLKGDWVLPFYGPMPFLSHYWDPNRPEHGFMGCTETCIHRMGRRWNMAMDYYSKGQLNQAYAQLGHVIHLLSDMSVPAHVHWDLHPFWDTYEMGYLDEFNNELPNGYNYQQWNNTGLDIVNDDSLLSLFTKMARIAQQFDSNDSSGTDPKHFIDHSGCREHQPLSSKLYVWYNVSYADAKIHAQTCMPAAISHVAPLYKIFWNQTEQFRNEIVKKNS